MEQNSLFSKLRQIVVIALLPFITFYFLTNCTEKPLQIDPNDILPDDDMLDVIIDTIPVELYTVSLEAFDTKSVGVSPLGCVNDTVVGILETDFICDIIYANEVSFDNDLDPDSTQILDLTIELDYNSYYGDSMDVNFNVYELYEPIPAYSKCDYILYSHMYSQEPVNDGPAFKGRLESNLDDTVTVYTIKLKNEFAERFIDTSLISDGIYDTYDPDVFKENFKGFYFAVEPRSEPGGGIITVNHYNSLMTLRTIEWNSDSAKWDTVKTVFYLGNPDSEFDGGGTHLNLYRSTLNEKLQQIVNDTLTSYSSAYVQSLAGTKVYLKLPTLALMRDTLSSAVSINRAQLVLPIDTIRYLRDAALYPPPLSLGVYDSKSNTYILDDKLREDYLGGYFDEDNYQYVLNIGNHIHEYLRNDSSALSDAFFLFASKGSPATYVEYTPSRVVLNGSITSRPPFVRIIYSKIP